MNSNGCNENTIKTKDLDDLKIAIESLVKLINDIDIENEFKEILLGIILDLKYAIDFYGIHGSDGFRLYSYMDGSSQRNFEPSHLNSTNLKTP